MQSALPNYAWRFWARLSARVRGFSFKTMAGSPTFLLVMAGLVLPNLLTFGTVASLIDIGLPPRTGSIMLYVALAMSARLLPFAVTGVLYIAVLTFDIVWTLTMNFGLRPHDLIVAIEQARRVHALSSPLYVTLLSVMTVTTISALYLLSKKRVLMYGSLPVMLAGGLALATVDYLSNADPRFYFGAMFGAEAPVTSAVKASGFDKVAGFNGRNTVLVLVESLGSLTDKKARSRIVAPIYDPRVTAEYDVTEGRITYYGSTTWGEMRELCNTRKPYKEFTESDGVSSCLPERFIKHGYATTAVHGFYSGMFERNQWYPRIGFQNMDFAETLMPAVKRHCGNAFRGPCDADLPPYIETVAAKTKRPDFIYWLTLNTHIPVPPGEALTNFDCDQPENEFGITRVCRMAELWHDVFSSVANLALNPAIGPAEILVVGDHAPPLWSKKGRGEFAAGRVPWYRLAPKKHVVASALDRAETDAAAFKFVP